MDFLQLIMLPDAALPYHLIDLTIIFLFMASLRLFASSISEVSFTELLATHDNGAAGIALSGAIIAVAILMMGVVAGDAGASYIDEVSLMASYGVVALILMWLTRKIFDHLSLPQISIHKEILKDNRAAAIVDAGNMIATAIIVRASMSWVDGSSFQGLIGVTVLYIVSQIILYAATQYRINVFKRRHSSDGKSLQGSLQQGNIALALRFSGYRIGIGLAVTATSGMVIYNPETLLSSLLAWSALAVALFIAQTLLSIALRYTLLPGVNVGSEVEEQHNIAIGAIEAAIYIGVGLAFVGQLGG